MAMTHTSSSTPTAESLRPRNPRPTGARTPRGQSLERYQELRSDPHGRHHLRRQDHPREHLRDRRLQLRYRADAEHRQPERRRRRRQDHLQPVLDHPQDRRVLADLVPDVLRGDRIQHTPASRCARASVPAAAGPTRPGSPSCASISSWSRSRRSRGATTTSRRRKPSRSHMAALQIHYCQQNPDGSLQPAVASWLEPW